MQELPPLRSRDECEKQLKVELAVGAIDNIDGLITQGHETAIEYGCQLLLEEIRLKVAARTKLKPNIVQHLLRDSVPKIRLTVVSTNWTTLTPGQQEVFIAETAEIFKEIPTHVKDNVHKGYYRSGECFNEGISMRAFVIEEAMYAAMVAQDEQKVLDYIDIVGLSIENNQKFLRDLDVFVNMLKGMPKVFHMFWEKIGKTRRNFIRLILAHPNEEVRRKEIERILDPATRKGDLSNWRESIGDGDRSRPLKEKILHCWVDDPSVQIRRYIAANTTCVEVLRKLSCDLSTSVTVVAMPRLRTYSKRKSYSKGYSQMYNARKKAKKEAEENNG